MKKCTFAAAVAMSAAVGAFCGCATVANEPVAEPVAPEAVPEAAPEAPAEPAPVIATVATSPMFSNNMVLQRGQDVKIWGVAAPGEAVTIEFAGQAVTAKAGADGQWEATLSPMEASKEDRQMVVKGENNAVTFDNVLVGDVWLCSGQSNMEMSFGWGIIGGDDFHAEAAEKFPMIRNMKIRKVTADYPQNVAPVERQWAKATDVWGGVTATGYFFARKLVQELDIPIGLIDDSWSGCRIEPFACVEGMEAVEAIKPAAEHVRSRDPAHETGRAAALETIAKIGEWADKAAAAVEAGGRPLDPMPEFQHLQNGWTHQYNAMVAPLVRYAIKGAIWYQGCSNGGEGDEYADKMEALVLGWRNVWGYDFPFYFVQLASFMGWNDNPAGGDGYARIRDAQRKSLRIPQTGMAVTIDIGNGNDIHPKEKLHVGERLASWALAKDYGKDIVYTGPLFKSLEFDGANAIVNFEDFSVGTGLMVGFKNNLDNEPVVEAPEGTELEGFAIAGEDKQWHWADARIDGGKVIVSSPDVEAPVAVRYGFRTNPLGHANLYNIEGFPASPFRSDDW